jgi:hypothetical protein
MFEIHTFTAQANVVEDRIRLAALDHAGATIGIWITRRLADRMIPLLADMIEQGTRPGLPRDIALAMSQQQLRQDREANPVPDVEVTQGSAEWLSRTVHFEPQGGLVVWTLSDDGANEAAMAMEADVVRAVLDIFLLMYRQLEWDLAPFPDWLTEDEAPAAEPHRLN